MAEFQYKTRKEQKAMSMKELGEYHCQRRKYEYKKGIPLKGIKPRKYAHPIVVGALKLDRVSSHEKINVLKNRKKPILFACTHSGGSDVERIVEALGTPSYIFFGDPAPMYKDIPVHTLLIIKGSIDVETRDKEDRHIAYERAKELLNKGGNLIIFPEGAWNVFEHLPVMKLYTGTVRMAIEGNADIIPIAVEQYDKEFIIKIGQKIVVNKNMDPKMLNSLLRDILATLKYEIWESQPMVHALPSTGYKIWENTSVYEQTTLQRSYDEIFRNSIVNRRSEYGVLQEVYDTMYKDPNDLTTDDLIVPIQIRLALIKEINHRQQQIDELTEKLHVIIEQSKNFQKGTSEYIEYCKKAQGIVTLIKEKIDRIRKILKYLNEEREKERKSEIQEQEEFDFDNPYYKKEMELQKRINRLYEKKNNLISIRIACNISEQQNHEKRISLN